MQRAFVSLFVSFGRISGPRHSKPEASLHVSSKHIAAIAASVAVVAAFGIGAFALAQSSASFDPQDFTSAYSKGADAANRGYQANPIDTDAEANRNKDDLDSNDKTAETEQANKDVFSDYPLQGASGTTAYNVTGQAELGGVGVSNGEGGATGSGNGSNTAGGAVVVKPDGNGDGANGSSDNAGNGNGSNNGGQNSGEGDDPAPTPSASEESYKVLPNDPGFDTKNTESNGNGIYYKPVNENNSSMASVDPEQAHAVIMQAGSNDSALYTGQKLDAWKVFCSLSTFYVYNGDSFAWTCSKDEFATYPYFRVDDFPEEVPSDPFTSTVSYRFNDADSWHTETVEYEPQQSCTYIVSDKLDDEGNPTVIAKSLNGMVNLFSYTERVLESMGYSEYSQLSHMILGWKEGDTEVSPFYTPTPGRHVLQPSGFAEVPENYVMDVSFYYLDDNMRNDFVNGTHLSYLQRLNALQNFGELGGFADSALTLNVPLGVQAIEINSWFAPINVGQLVLPKSTIVVELSLTGLVVWDSFSVAEDSPYFAATDNGILTTKDGTQYVGVPLSLDELVVPANVQKVTLQDGNDQHRIVLEATAADELPDINLYTLNYCNIVVDDDLLPALLANSGTAINSGYDNTISLASDPSVQYHTDNGMVYSDSTLKLVTNAGSNLIKVDGPHTVAEGCFEGNTDVQTVVLSDDGTFTFEPGSLTGGNVQTIVCANEAQRVSVQAQLAAAGAPNAEAVVAGESVEGYRYFTTDKDGVAFTTLLSAPDEVESYTGTITAQDGTTICPNAISSFAFANHENLQWALIDEGTTVIEANAFTNCDNLQGVLIQGTGTVTVGTGAFDGCDSMRFLASRAMHGDFNLTSAPNYNCALYRPTKSDGSDGYLYNFQYFTPESGVTDYEAVQLPDGGYVLYGCDDNGPWLAIASGSTITGEATLPQTTTEIFLNAFKGVQGDFTVNWRDLEALMYVDGSAFTNSTVSGEVFIGSRWIDHVSIGSDAFSNCPNITSVVSEAPMFDCASWAFSSCANLTSVKLAVSYSYDLGYTLQSGIFYGDKALESIEIDSWNPSSLTRFGKGFSWRFDGDYDNVDDSDRIHLIVPEGSEEYYLNDWLYAWLGYDDYDQYYTETYQNLYTETGVEPSRVQVKEAMSEGLLTAENQLRKMMGMEQVDQSSFITIDEQDGYVFQTGQGTTTLINAPADAKVIDLNSVIGDKYENVVLGDSVFAGCSELEQVIVGDKISAIEPNAFAGCDGVTVTFPEECTTQLLGDSATNPFRFGADIKLDISEDAQINYLNTWPMQCVGILDDFALGDYFFDVWISLWDLYPDEGPNAEQLNLAVNTPFMEQENYLRGLMGLEPIDDITQLASYIDCSGMVNLSEDAQREPVVAALSTLSAHHHSVAEVLQAAGLISSRAGDGKAIDGSSESESSSAPDCTVEIKEAIKEEPLAKDARNNDEKEKEPLDSTSQDNGNTDDVDTDQQLDAVEPSAVTENSTSSFATADETA